MATHITQAPLSSRLRPQVECAPDCGRGREGVAAMTSFKDTPPMTTKESEVDVLAVMDKVPKVVDLASYHYGEWASAAQGFAYKPDSYVVDTLVELRKARAAVAEVFEAIKVYREDYRQSGCPDPACIVCRRSKAAEDRLDTALRNAGVKV